MKKIAVIIEIPEGFDLVGDKKRLPKIDEYYLFNDRARKATINFENKTHYILKKDVKELNVIELKQLTDELENLENNLRSFIKTAKSVKYMRIITENQFKTKDITISNLAVCMSITESVHYALENEIRKVKEKINKLKYEAKK